MEQNDVETTLTLLESMYDTLIKKYNTLSDDMCKHAMSNISCIVDNYLYQLKRINHDSKRTTPGTV